MILERLKKLFKTVMPDVTIDYDAVTPDSALQADLGFSSISLLLMAIVIEEEFGIMIERFEGKSFTTVGDVIAFIEANTDGR